MSKQTHFGDPCIHCGTPQMEVAPGACPGDASKARVIGYASLGVRWDGVERFRYRLSTNEVREDHRHISEHAPYYHFGRSEELIQPPRYDERLRDAVIAPAEARSASAPTVSVQVGQDVVVLSPPDYDEAVVLVGRTLSDIHREQLARPSLDGKGDPT